MVAIRVNNAQIDIGFGSGLDDVENFVHTPQYQLSQELVLARVTSWRSFPPKRSRHPAG
jgi:hypothetical protein